MNKVDNTFVVIRIWQSNQFLMVTNGNKRPHNFTLNTCYWGKRMAISWIMKGWDWLIKKMKGWDYVQCTKALDTSHDPKWKETTFILRVSNPQTHAAQHITSLLLLGWLGRRLWSRSPNYKWTKPFINSSSSTWEKSYVSSF